MTNLTRQLTRSISLPLLMIVAVFGLLVSPLPLNKSLAQETQTKNFTLRLDQESEQILAGIPAGSVFQESDSTRPSIIKFDSDTRKFKAVSKGSADYKIIYKDTANKTYTQSGKVTVQGVSKWVVTHKKKELKDDEIIISSKGQKSELEVRAEMEDGDSNVTEVTLESSDKDVFDIDKSSSPLKLWAKKDGTGTLTAKLGKEEKKISVKVLEPIDKPKSAAILGTPKIELSEGAKDYTTPSLSFRTTNDKEVPITEEGRDFEIKVTEEAKSKLIDPDGYRVRAKLVDSKEYKEARITVKADVVTEQGIKADGTPDTLRFPIELIVVVPDALVQFEQSNKILFEDATETLRAYVRGRDGSRRSDIEIKRFEFVHRCDEKFVELIPDVNNNTVTVVRRLLDTSEDNLLKDCRNNEPTSVAIEAVAQKVDGTGPEYRGRAVLRLRRIKGFQLLAVKINIMDKQTAQDLYGKVASNEYYILTVRMFNNLKDDQTGRYTGDSIIVYSGSIELAVNLEKQYDNGSKSAKKVQTKPSDPEPTASYIDDGRWYQVDAVKDLYGIANNKIEPRKLSSKERIREPNADPVCEGTITYRPLTFEMVVNTVDRRDKRSVRSRVFDSLELVGLGAAFASAIKFPRRGRDLPIVTDSFSNLLVPGLEKVFPSFKEQNRQNIVSQVMKPLEEIPYGSDLTRVLFIPKRSIKGIVPDHRTRISQICPFYFKVEVAVIDKRGQTTVEQGVRQ